MTNKQISIPSKNFQIYFNHSLYLISNDVNPTTRTKLVGANTATKPVKEVIITYKAFIYVGYSAAK